MIMLVFMYYSDSIRFLVRLNESDETFSEMNFGYVIKGVGVFSLGVCVVQDWEGGRLISSK